MFPKNTQMGKSKMSSKKNNKRPYLQLPCVKIQKYYKKDIKIISNREKNIKGVHTVFYKSAYDEIEITHSAKNRETFASGAIMSAEWLVGKKGFYNFLRIFLPTLDYSSLMWKS